jgi:hypothetical protein
MSNPGYVRTGGESSKGIIQRLAAHVDEAHLNLALGAVVGELTKRALRDFLVSARE